MMDDDIQTTDHETTGKVIPIKGRKSTRRATTDASADRPLTSRQEEFARLVGFESLSKSEAYRRAYDASKMNENTLWNEASRLAAHPGVSQMIAAEKARKTAVYYHDGDLARRLVCETLVHEMSHAERSSDRLRAAELLGKMSHVQAFAVPDQLAVPPGKTDPSKMSVEELDAEIARRLGQSPPDR